MHSLKKISQSFLEPMIVQRSRFQPQLKSGRRTQKNGYLVIISLMNGILRKTANKCAQIMDSCCMSEAFSRVCWILLENSDHICSFLPRLLINMYTFHYLTLKGLYFQKDSFVHNTNSIWEPASYADNKTNFNSSVKRLTF